MTSKSRLLTYWIAQCMGWGFYTILLLVSLFVFGKGDLVLPKVIALQFIIGLTCLGVSHYLRLFFKKHGWADLNLKKLIFRVVLANLIAALIAQLMIHLLMIFVLNWPAYRPIVWAEIPVYTFNVFLMFMAWSVIYFSVHFFEKARQSKIDQLRAEAALKDAALIALKAQINPHFLFNALNNIRALILENPMKARQMLSHLSELLRYAIVFSQQEQVTVQAEAEIVQNYLMLESIHYDERLSYCLDISPDTEDKKIPPMIVQLLVENAVKHGISQRKEGGNIAIRVALEGDQLFIRVANSGRLTQPQQKGTGIRNALDRIRLLFATEPEFSLQQLDQQVVATLRFPAIV